MDCISLAQDGKKWWTVLNIVVTSGFPEVRVISRLSEDCWLLIKDCAVKSYYIYNNDKVCKQDSHNKSSCL